MSDLLTELSLDFYVTFEIYDYDIYALDLLITLANLLVVQGI